MENKIILPKILEGKFWNKGPMVVTGCTKCSPGCANCWSEKNHAIRMSNPAVAHVYSPELMDDGKFNGKVQFNLHLLEKAVKTKAPQVIAIWNDLYNPGVTLEQVTDAHCIMSAHPRHTFLIVTKRPERAAGFCQGVHDMTGASLPDNIWHIVTMENQAMVEKRMPHLLNIPGKRGIIIEPMLGEVNIHVKCLYPDVACDDSQDELGGMWCGQIIDNCPGYNMSMTPGIHQVILGGETGTGARPMHPDWVRSVRDQCHAAGVPFYFKSWGEWRPVTRDVEARMRMINDPNCHVWPDEGIESHVSLKVGRKKAGRTLDGIEHNDLAWVTS